jgi:hypothetical protein
MLKLLVDRWNAETLELRILSLASKQLSQTQNISVILPLDISVYVIWDRALLMYGIHPFLYTSTLLLSCTCRF